MAQKWACEQLQRNSFQITFQKSREGCLFVPSDIHIDSKKCRLKLLASHFEDALERNAPIVIGGDLLDLMGGRSDKRSAKSDLLPALKSNTYVIDVVDYAAEWLAPFVKNICLIAQGNHCTAVRRHLEVDPTILLIERLNDRHRTKIKFGNYAGWLKVQTKDICVRGNYHHGSGYSRPTAATRRTMTAPGADFYLYGHTHDKWSEYAAHDYRGRRKEALHIGQGTYKDDYDDGSQDFAVEKAHRVKPLGGWFLRVSEKDKNPLGVEAISA